MFRDVYPGSGRIWGLKKHWIPDQQQWKCLKEISSILFRCAEFDKIILLRFKVEFCLFPSQKYSAYPCSTTGKPTRSFATERVSLDSV